MGDLTLKITKKRFMEILTRIGILSMYNYENLKYDLYGRISKNKYKIVKVNDSNMFIHLGDKGISRDLYLYKEREKFSYEVMKTFLKEMISSSR